MSCGYFDTDIYEGEELFRKWYKSGQLKCFTTKLEYETKEGNFFNKKWVKKSKSVRNCDRIFGNELWRPQFSCQDDNCRNLTIIKQEEFTKKDYDNYQNEGLFIRLLVENRKEQKLNID